MKVSYYQDTDSLYIELAPRPGASSEEVRPGVVLDLDARGAVVGIDIDRASLVIGDALTGSGPIPFERVGGPRNA
jgi:uncharacterized protein YuzE